MKEGIGAYGVPQHSAAYDQRDILSRSVSKRNRWERQRKKYIVLVYSTVHSFYYCLLFHLPFLFFPSDRVCTSLIILLSIHPSCYLVLWIAFLLSERVFSLLCDPSYILHIMTLWMCSCTYIDRYYTTYVRYFLIYYIQ